MIILSTFIGFNEFFNDIAKSLIIAILTAAITAVFAAIFTNKYFTKISFATDLAKYGFKSFVSTDNISENEYRHIFSHANEIKILFVTGTNFFKNIKHQEMIKKALKRGAKIEILLARKNSQFLKDIYNLEFCFSNREFGNTLDSEVETVQKILDDINKDSTNKLLIRYFSTEYRLPLIIASFGHDSNEKIMTWLQITLPPAKASNHLLMKMECKKSELEMNKKNNITMLISHFNTIWENSLTWEDSAEQYWKKKYNEVLPQVNHPKKCLILVSAQHPLINGITPNEEFKNRLNEAIKLYNKLVSTGKNVKIYVPGSKHTSNEVIDLISLSQAGKNYLLENNILETDIYADEMNIKYKKDIGVYNSADECYVAASIYKDEKFEKLYCFCSPIQVMKNQLFLIENNIMADIYSVPSTSYYHNPFFEASEIIPDVLFYDHSWQQEDSFYGKKTRNERKPK